MSDIQAPYFFWAPPEKHIRVIEEADDIRSAIIAGAPDAPKVWEYPFFVDTEALADDIAQLAGKEMSLRTLVQKITEALVQHGWTHRMVANDAVTLAREIVEGQP